MGNTSFGKNGLVFDGLCTGRGYPEFLAPNKEHATYEFDYRRTQGELVFSCGDESGPLPGALSARGFLLESERTRAVPKWRTVKEYSRIPDVRLNLSGRFFVQLPELYSPPKGGAQAVGHRGTCVFKICVRGTPVFESLRTRTFTHTAHVVTSGVFFALFVESLAEGMYLRPKLMLVLRGGDEVPLVEDRLGPLLLPQAFFADFSILDDGGRNLQMDLIFRVFPNATSTGTAGLPPHGGLKTLRTCLQDYTTFNSNVQSPCVALGSSELPALMATATAYLQNLVLSEAPVTGAPAAPAAGAANAATPRAAASAAPAVVVGGDAAGGGCSATPATSDAEALNGLLPAVSAAPPAWAALEAFRDTALVLYEGAALRLSSPDSRTSHALSLAEWAPEGGGDVAAGGEAGSLQRPLATPPGRLQPAQRPEDSFWNHIEYGEPVLRESGARTARNSQESLAKGMFWLTREAVEKKGVYFHCASTLAQALTMCIIFRFSTPPDYLHIIENKDIPIIRTLTIPTNGVVLGIEEDPRHPAVFRAFVEHRNEIVDDMVVCEGSLADLSQVVAHQEVYDGGEEISYRLTLIFPDGSRQSSVLQFCTERLEPEDSQNNVEEPSARFPICPCVSRQFLSPTNRIFVYTSASMEEADAAVTPKTVEENGFQTPTAPHRDLGSGLSDCCAEDWQSVGGGASDNEIDPMPALAPVDPSIELKVPVPVLWKQNLVDTMVLMSRVDEAPFRCIPPSMS